MQGHWRIHASDFPSTASQIVCQRRLLSGVNGEIVVVLDLHPYTNIDADKAAQGWNPVAGSVDQSISCYFRDGEGQSQYLGHLEGDCR
jgi:hypothetical protein